MQGALNQEWRVAELLHRLLNYLKPFLTHPFQNVRERLGRFVFCNTKKGCGIAVFHFCDLVKKMLVQNMIYFWVHVSIQNSNTDVAVRPCLFVYIHIKI